MKHIKKHNKIMFFLTLLSLSLSCISFFAFLPFWQLHQRLQTLDVFAHVR